jgi:hypothetical protein
MRTINYREQRNDDKVNGLSPFSQCFSCSDWMYMSWVDSSIDVKDDASFDAYLLSLETKIGPRENPGDKHPSLDFATQAEGATEFFNSKGITGHMVFTERFPFSDLIRELQDKPITIGTEKMSNLPDGHIILLVDYEQETDSFVVNDPFGNALTNYTDPNGEAVRYPVAWLHPYVTDNQGNCRVVMFEAA